MLVVKRKTLLSYISYIFIIIFISLFIYHIYFAVVFKRINFHWPIINGRLLVFSHYYLVTVNFWSE